MKQILQTIATVILALALEIMGTTSVKASKSSDRLEVIPPPKTSQPLANQLPIITVWYESALMFGTLGNPQNQINILGNVRDPDGSVTSLTYSLNGRSPKSLTLGTKNKRLIRPGDFNVNLYINELASGTNTLLLTARDNTGAVQTKTVKFTYTPKKVWPLPYSTHWGSTGSIMAQAQAVDGLWKMSTSGVAPVYFGYDRLVAIGDVNWTEYEVLVPVTVRAFYPDPNNTTDAGGVGIISRWSGHEAISSTEQPATGWTRMGAYAYYSNRLKRLALRMDGSTVYTQSFPFELNTTYMFKLRSETVSGVGRYSFKVWEKGAPEPAWNDAHFSSVYNRSDGTSDPQHGSILLVAHRVDATFGNVTVCPLEGVNYALNVSRSGSGTISYQPGQQASYSCGQGVTLTAKPATGWTFVRWSGDSSSTNPTISFNMTRAINLTANFAPLGESGEKIYLPLLGR